MSIVYIGIDPGVHGAVGFLIDSAYTEDRPEMRVFVVDMPGTARQLFEVLSTYQPHLTEVLIALEIQPPMPKQSVSTSAVQQRHFGQIEGVLACTGLPVTLVHPATWKAQMELRLTKAETLDEQGRPLSASQRTAVSKRKSLEKARALWPSAPLGRLKDNGRAEALLLAEWLRTRKRD